MPATTNAVKNIIDVYATPAMEVNSKVVFTNTTPIGAYRGAGRPEGNYYMERLIDTAAREMGIDKVELRRRNHIAPAQMPYKAPSAMNYDSGEFTTVLDKAWPRPTGRASTSARPRAGAGTSCAAAASAPISRSPARRPRNMAVCASRPTAPSPC
jgi:CO/xanthine dehydrogenase Mo-binding subunit